MNCPFHYTEKSDTYILVSLYSMNCIKWNYLFLVFFLIQEQSVYTTY